MQAAFLLEPGYPGGMAGQDQEGFGFMDLHRVLMTVGVWGLLLLPGSIRSNGDVPFRESVIVFNTVCARCHEAQCSGRLGLDQAFAATRTHILRHYAAATGKEWLQQELFQILNHMKEKCAYYPMQFPVALARDWGGEMLEKFTTLQDRNYFIPLGRFSPGGYLMQLVLESDAKITVHLISGKFEMAIDSCYETTDRRLSLPFRIEEQGSYFFRMYSSQRVRLTRLTITAGDGGS